MKPKSEITIIEDQNLDIFENQLRLEARCLFTNEYREENQTTLMGFAI
jgi:hypothetical protein